MKTPHLLASFAVAATVAAADLKDPATVAREWGESTGSSSPVPLTDDLSLKGQIESFSRLAKPFRPAMVVPRSSPRRSNPLTPDKGERLPESLYDAPLYRVPERLPNSRPRGGVPWEYNGEVYWLVPLNPPARE